MDNQRYVIEAKDQYGWFDYNFYEDAKDALNEAMELTISFPYLRVIDRENMAVIWDGDK